MVKLKTTIFLFLMMSLVSFTPFSLSKDKDNLEIEGEKLNDKLSKNKGQLVLINFWASYDANSRIENSKFAHLMKTYQNSEFKKANGFVVIAVSLDPYRSIYNETIKRDDLQNAQNIHVSNGFNSKLAINYKLGNKFSNILLDASGNLVAKDLTAKKLNDLLNQQKTN